MTSPIPLSPVERLEGLRLPNGWTVTAQINKLPNATGGHFSVGYKVRHDNGNEGFLKAIDFSRAFASRDPTRKLQELTETFNFERDVLQRCKSKNLDHVVTALEDGSVIIDGLPVPYLIFELAEHDIRGHMDLSAGFDLVWALRMLHNVAVGLQQLHGIGIAHQDLKPSNVLVFQQLIAKLADLGTSACVGYQPPHDGFVIPGALAYAPPELRYKYTHPEFRQRRFGGDTFLLGNIIVFAFTRLTMSSVLFSNVAAEHMPVAWTGKYEEVLPYLQRAFSASLISLEPEIPELIRADIITMLRQLCEPDLSKRGHPLNRFENKNTFSLERYITKLDVLFLRAKIDIFRRQ